MNLRVVFLRSLGVVLLVSIISCNPQERVSDESKNVIVTIDLSVLDMISDFEIGFTHTNSRWEDGHPEAVARVKELFEDAKIRYQVTHIYGWGVSNPNPKPGVYDWKSLDKRMDLIHSMDGVVPVITLCCAPDWMKDYNPNLRWQIESAPRDDNVEDFANLCRQVALRYPDVKYFQIWNEFKGYRSWSDGVETKDMERFNRMYNAVFEAVKEVRPDVKIGGPYIPMEGRAPGTHEQKIIVNWLENTLGADFFTFDGWVEGWPPGGNTEEWMMGRSSFFGDLTREFREMADLPMWISEYYPGKSNNEEFNAAHYASTYYHSLKSGTRMALLWGDHRYISLFTGTESADGGGPLLQYYVLKTFNHYFGPGTQLYKTESSSDDLEVLASQEKTMLINKRPEVVSVDLAGKKLLLEGYEVRVVDTPRENEPRMGDINYKGSGEL